MYQTYLSKAHVTSFTAAQRLHGFQLADSQRVINTNLSANLCVTSGTNSSHDQLYARLSRPPIERV